MKWIYLFFIPLSTFSCTSAKLNYDSIEFIVETTNLKKDVSYLSQLDPARNYKNPEVLDSVADYISKEFMKTADTVFFQFFKAKGITYKNVIARFGTQHQKKLIVGAHYDVCHDFPGADDNASGVAGLLEIGRKLNSDSLPHQIELVAYSLEEPPFFRSNKMGSYIHAASLNPKNIIGMICLEMIGFYSEEKNSQDYPISALKLKYPNTGNFIALVGNTKQKQLINKFEDSMIQNCKVGVESIKAPKALQGIDFSDHLNYWKHGMKAIMITNTAFYRNKNYHTINDTKETLNYEYMAWVVNGVLKSIQEKF